MSTESAHAPEEVTDATFQQTVVEASQTTPVLVDFWAPWCGPCKVIGPILEKLATESAGKFKLVKVNVDENPMLAQSFMIRSIPTVKLILNSEIKDEFLGALPEPDIRKFLEKNLPTPSAEGAVEGLHAYAAGDAARAAAAFEGTLAGEPGNAAAWIGMGLIQFDKGDLEQAKGAVGNVNEVELEKLPDKAFPEKWLAVLKARIFLGENVQNGVGPGQSSARVDALAESFHQSCLHALQGAYEQALEGFLAIVKQDRRFNDDAGRKGMLAVFDLLPLDSELTYDYRNKLSSILFS